MEITQLFNESVELIKNNPDLRTDQIPEHLFEVWFHNGEITEEHCPELAFALSIFDFAKKQYADTHPESQKPKISSSGREFVDVYPMHNFEVYQYMLAWEYTRREMGGFTPVKIFDFANYGMTLESELEKEDVDKFMKLASTLIPMKHKMSVLQNKKY